MAASAWLIAARRAIAQQAVGRVYSIGLLVPNQLKLQAGYEAYVEEMRSRGDREGGNMRVLLKEAGGRLESLPALARELVGARVDVIVAFNTPGSRAAIDATREIPVVITQTGDPVGSGFVTNLARPGGNVTGVSNIVAFLAPKRMELLKKMIPALRRVAVLFNPEDPIIEPQVRDVKKRPRSSMSKLDSFPYGIRGIYRRHSTKLSGGGPNVPCGFRDKVIFFERRASNLPRNTRFPSWQILQ